MQPVKLFLSKPLILVTATVVSQWSYAQDKPDLPEAFDAGWKGQKVCELLYETESVRAGRCTFPPGVGHERHFHYPHFGYVLEGGTLRIVDETGNESVRQTITGQSWSTNEITLHSALNIGDTTTSYLIIEPRAEQPGSK
jgi:quercetin dioxygenase-like cupin family protein